MILRTFYKENVDRKCGFSKENVKSEMYLGKKKQKKQCEVWNSSF